jgi:hypothetical protein
MNEALQRASVGWFTDIGHAGLEVPTRTMRVAESRPSGRRGVLSAGRAESDLAQQIRTRNEGHWIFLEHLSEVVHQFGVSRRGANEQEASPRVRLYAHRRFQVGRTLLLVRHRSVCAISEIVADSRVSTAIDCSP